MGSSVIRFRSALESDAIEIANFYAPYVRNTAINFEYSEPDAEEFARRIRKVEKKFPFIVAERESQDGTCSIVGYVFATPRESRPAWAWTAETSIYLDENYRGLGIGTALYRGLEEILTLQNVVELIACITVSERDDLLDITGHANVSASYLSGNCFDDHLAPTSPRFHAALGYTIVGRERGVGFKFHTWYDKLWMQKHLVVPRPKNPKEIIPVNRLSQETIDSILQKKSFIINK